MRLAAEALKRYREEPDGAIQFVRHQFHVEPDPDQADALVAYQKANRLALKASKGTGKTTTLSWIGWHFLTCWPDSQIAATSISGANLRDGLWKELATWRAQSPFLQKAFHLGKHRIVSTIPLHEETWWLAARTWQRSANPEEQANTLAGLHAKYMGFLIDESGAMPDPIMATAEAVLASGQRCFIAQAGNPTNLSGPLYRACTRERDLWKVIAMTGDPDNPKRSPRVSIEWARQQIKKYGRNSPWVKVNVFGEFPDASLNTLLGPNEVEAAMNRHLEREAFDWAQKRIGIDVARFGDDLTVLFPRQGLVAFNPVALSHPRDSAVSVTIATRVMLAKEKFGSEVEFFDATGGWAAGARDIMVAAGHSPINVQYSGEPLDAKFENRRAELWWSMAEWVKGGAALPPTDELVAELTEPQYSFTPKGKFLMEPKDHVKERLGRSPNYADALANTFALPEMPGGTRGRLRGKRSAEHEWNPYAEEHATAVSDFDPYRDHI